MSTATIEAPTPTTPRTKAEQVLEASLDLVNQARECRGLRPLDSLRPGVPGLQKVCPLARSLPPGIAVKQWTLSSLDRELLADLGEAWGMGRPGVSLVGTPMLPLPAALQAFVRYFDDTTYPELIR